MNSHSCLSRTRSRSRGLASLKRLLSENRTSLPRPLQTPVLLPQKRQIAPRCRGLRQSKTGLQRSSRGLRLPRSALLRRASVKRRRMTELRPSKSAQRPKRLAQKQSPRDPRLRMTELRLKTLEHKLLMPPVRLKRRLKTLRSPEARRKKIVRHLRTQPRLLTKPKSRQKTLEPRLMPSSRRALRHSRGLKSACRRLRPP
mmetsp:Transcript_13771/g.23621  ORF Transcript_13771/g.23621 Transcript_13771/m.23621 type:complete len:200 (-) Transcript_13771:358-957(-)